MTVAADAAELRLVPSLDEVRSLARDHALVPLRHTFIADCETAVRENDSHVAVKEVVARAVSDPTAVLKAVGEPSVDEVRHARLLA